MSNPWLIEFRRKSGDDTAWDWDNEQIFMSRSAAEKWMEVCIAVDGDKYDFRVTEYQPVQKEEK